MGRKKKVNKEWEGKWEVRKNRKKKMGSYGRMGRKWEVRKNGKKRRN